MAVFLLYILYGGCIQLYPVRNTSLMLMLRTTGYVPGGPGGYGYADPPDSDIRRWFSRQVPEDVFYQIHFNIPTIMINRVTGNERELLLEGYGTRHPVRGDYPYHSQCR